MNMSPALLKTTDSTAMRYLVGSSGLGKVTNAGGDLPIGSDDGRLAIADRSRAHSAWAAGLPVSEPLKRPRDISQNPVPNRSPVAMSTAQPVVASPALSRAGSFFSNPWGVRTRYNPMG